MDYVESKSKHESKVSVASKAHASCVGVVDEYPTPVVKKQAPPMEDVPKSETELKGPIYSTVHTPCDDKVDAYPTPLLQWVKDEPTSTKTLKLKHRKDPSPLRLVHLVLID